jgi:DNA-binding HxlR family transcriptional regulator
VKTYGQYCPIAKAVEVLGERWSMLVVRELLIGSRHFNDIARGLPMMSRTMLSKRLRQLDAAGLVERVDGGYRLSPAGEELRGLVFGLGDWGARWLLADPLGEECDIEVLMWWAHCRLDTSPLPDRRVVIHFVFQGERRRFWVVVEEVGNSVCLSDPGFDVDAVVTSDAVTMHRVWYERETVADAVRDGRMTFGGPPAVTRVLPQVLTLAPARMMGQGDGAPRPRLYTG